MKHNRLKSLFKKNYHQQTQLYSKKKQHPASGSKIEGWGNLDITDYHLDLAPL